MTEDEFFEEMRLSNASPAIGCMAYLLGVAAVMVAICLLTGCKTVYVPVESGHHDTLIVSKWHTQFVDRWRDREVHDTLVSIKVDSVQVPYPVEKKLGFWEKTKLASTGFVGALIVAAITGVVLWLRRRYKRK